ncbi:MAG: tetratricopeptide repeat protein [bacterium]|nr:tetratricopeptide repeat protein [bacterium]
MATSSTRTRSVAAALGLIALTALAYWPVSDCGYIWDDNHYVTQNPTLSDTDGLRRIWSEPGATPQYYPLVFTSFWVEHHLWGTNPWGYHIVNVLLHGVGSVLVWRVLRRLGLPGAWVASAIFAVHPVHVESVAWITERKNVLSGAFYLAAALAYLRFCGIGDAPERIRERDWRFYGLAVALFIAALLSKSVTASLPAALVLILWWKRRLSRSDAAPLLPMFVLGVAMGVFTAMMEKYHVGAQGEDWSTPLAHRSLIAGRAAWFYVGKLLWPANLTFIYPRWSINPGDVWWYVPPVAVLALLVVLFVLRERIGRGSLVAALFFGGTLVPALGFIDVYPFRYSFVADHFQYLASLGPIAWVVAAGGSAFGMGRGHGEDGGLTVRRRTIARRIGWAASVVVLVLLMVLTGRQCRIYRDQETLWRDTLEKNPAAWMAHHNLATILSERGHTAEAIAHYTQALLVKPRSFEAHNGLAIALARVDRLDEAITHFTRAAELRPEDATPHYNLGHALVKHQRDADAVDSLRTSLRIEPNHANRHVELGQALARLERKDEAAKAYQQALAIDPAHAGALRDLVRLSRKPAADRGENP